MPHRLVQSQQIKQDVHGTSAFGQFNDWLATRITTAVGSMLCAYIFVLLALISFPAAFQALLAGDTLAAIGWLSQSFIQLVLLPIIIVGTRVITSAQDARAATDHDVLVTLEQINYQQLRILETLQAILDTHDKGTSL